MSRPKSLIALALVLLVGLCPAQRRRWSAPELKNGAWEKREFHSASLGVDVTYGIYLPKSYAKEGNERWYPLAVWLHGMFEDDQRFHFRGGSATLDKLIGEGKVPEMILVSPYGGRSNFFTNGKSSGAWEDMVAKDLMAHLQKTFRIAKKAEYRAIMGVSMGGMGALKIGMRHPDLFKTIGAHSAALFPPDPENLSDRFKEAYVSWGRRLGVDDIFGAPIDKEIWQSNNPLHLAQTKAKATLCSLSIYFDCGTKDRYQFDEPNTALDKVLGKREIPHTWHLLEGVGHSWGSGGQMPERLAKSLTFVGQAWARAAKKEQKAEPKNLED